MFAKNNDMTDTEAMLGELDRIVSEELKKKDSERDDKLIDECIEEMAKLKNVRTGYSQEEIAVKFEEIQTKAAGTSMKPPVWRKSIRRSVAAVCAACLVLVCGVATVAWNPYSAIKQWFLEVTQTPSGTTFEINSITYTNQGNTEKYSTISELLKNNNLNIHYPSVLPEDIYITRIDSLKINGFEHINICFNNQEYHINIQLNTPIQLNLSEYEIIESNQIKFYLYIENERYIAQGHIDSNLYIIEAPNYQNILTIINNFKKG